MGRIRNRLVKQAAHKLMELHGDEFTNNFETNKQLVNKYVSVAKYYKKAYPEE